MSIPINISYTIKEEMSDTSIMLNEENLTVNNDPIFTFVPIKKEKHNKLSEDLTRESHEQVKKDSVLDECVKEKISFQSYGNKLKESQVDPLAINCSDIENNMMEYPCIVCIKEEIPAEIQEEHDNIDIGEHSLEIPAVNDNTNFYEENISDSGHSISKDIGNGLDIISVRDGKQFKKYEWNEWQTFSTQAELQKVPIDSVHKSNKKYKCNECHKIFSSKKYLKIHIDNVHEEIKTYECNTCYKKLSSSQKLTMHIDSVHIGIKRHENKNHECNECKKFFSRLSDLKRHISGVHRKIKNFMCKYCDKMYFSKQNLQNHIDSMHKGIKKYYECNVCSKLLSRSDRLQQHIEMVHKRIKNLKCDECQKMFFTRGSLQRHIDCVHRGLQMFECGECHKRFSQAGSLTKHKRRIHRVHKESKKYEFMN